MAPIAMEFVTMKLRSGAIAVTDSGTNEGKAMAEVRSTILASGGVQFYKLSNRVEDETVMHEFLVWNETAAFEKFGSSEGVGDLLDKIVSLSESGKMKDLQYALYDIVPSPSEALSQEVTETLLSYHHPDISEEKMAAFDAAIEGLLRAIEGPMRGHSSANARGWSQQLVSTDKFEGGKARVHMTLIGWNSVAAHMVVRDTEEFQGSIQPIRDSGAKLEMFHVARGTVEVVPSP